MPLDISRIQVLCFDIDGTLSDTDDRYVYLLSRWLSLVRWLFPRHDPHPFARWLAMAVESPANFVYSALDWIGLDALFQKLRCFLSSHLARLGWGFRPPIFWLLPSARPMLEYLSQRYPLAIVSARDLAATLAFLDQFQLSGFFRTIAHSQTCLHTKPFPDPIQWVARELGVPVENCLMIGDTTVDIRSGKAAGAQTVGVLCGFGTEAELKRAGADLILPSTIDLANWLVVPDQPVSVNLAELERETS